MKLKLGDVLRCDNKFSEVYIYAHVKNNHTNLIGLYTGNRWSDDSLGFQLTLEELNKDELVWEYVGRLE